VCAQAAAPDASALPEVSPDTDPADQEAAAWQLHIGACVLHILLLEALGSGADAAAGAAPAPRRAGGDGGGGGGGGGGGDGAAGDLRSLVSAAMSKRRATGASEDGRGGGGGGGGTRQASPSQALLDSWLPGGERLCALLQAAAKLRLGAVPAGQLLSILQAAYLQIGANVLDGGCRCRLPGCILLPLPAAAARCRCRSALPLPLRPRAHQAREA
jgi:hypothetical protein